MMMQPQPLDSGGGGGGGDDEFPVGLRVLVVDDDPICLRIIEQMLKKCRYRVTTSSRAVMALEILRENKGGGFDIVLSDVHMPDMDGFKLLERIGLEMDLPVIMMSADDKKEVVMKGVTHGACDYLIKPVSLEALKNIWQHVVRKKKNEFKDLDHSGSLEESERVKKGVDDADNVSSGNEGSWKVVKRKKEGEEEDEFEEREDTSAMKKPRVVWSVELHQQFVAAVNQLGLDKAVPKKILELMNNPTLTRENVASHLQKYRLYLKRLSVPQHQGRADPSFSTASDASFSSISSLDGYDLQALAASGQLPPQALMSLHSGQQRHTNICMDMSTADQRGFLNPDAQLANPLKIRPAIVQQVNASQASLLYGPSIAMDPRQIGQTQHVLRSYGNMGVQVTDGTPGFSSLPPSFRMGSPFSSGIVNGHSTNSFLVQMNQQGQHISLAKQHEHIQIGLQQQPQPRGQLVNGTREQDTRISSNMGQQMASNGISNHGLVRNGNAITGGASLQGNYVNPSPYGSVPGTLYPSVQNSCMSGSSSVTHVNNTIVPNQTSTGMIQDALAVGGIEAVDNITSLKGGKDIIPNYDMFNDIHPSKNQEWKLQNMNLAYESSQQLGAKQSNIDYCPSVTSHPDFNATFKDRTARNTCTVRKEIFSIRTEIEHEKVECVSQDRLLVDDSFPNELLNVIGRQQDTIGQAEPEFNFERYSFET